MSATEQHLSILLVDDDHVDRLAVRRALGKADLGEITIVEAERAVDGFAKITGEPFDCAFFDFRLPDRDGVALLRDVRDAGVRTPVILLTGFGDEQTVLDAMKAGATDYVPKALVSPERLGQALRSAIRLGNAERQAAAAHAAQERYANQLRRLAEAAVAVNDSETITQLLDAASMHACLITDASATRVRLARPVAVELAHDAKGEGWFSIDGEDPYEMTSPMIVTLPGRDGKPVGEILLDLWARHGSDDVVLGQLARLVAGALENARLYRAAQRATRARDDVLATVSHDMRNPLHTIALSSSYLAEVFLNDLPDAALQQTQIIKRAVDRANRLIQDLLDISRMDAGGFSICATPVPPDSLINEAVEAMAATATAARVTMKFYADADLPDVMADRERLQQVFGNLIGNALKFTAAGGSVQISATACGPSRVRFAVRDTGQGIAEESLPHVFDRFWQARNTTRTSAGLGLAIAKGIVMAHGGSITATSKVGEGTEIVFELPVA